MSDPHDQPGQDKAGKRKRRNTTDETSWSNLHFWEIQPVRDVMLLAVIFGVLWLGYEASIVTVPLLLAMLFAYLFEPVVQRITRIKAFSREGAAALIIAVSTFVIIVPLSVVAFFAVTQGVTLVTSLASNVIWLTDTVQEGKVEEESAPPGPWGPIAAELINVKQIALEERDRQLRIDDEATDEGDEAEPISEIGLSERVPIVETDLDATEEPNADAAPSDGNGDGAEQDGANDGGGDSSEGDANGESGSEQSGGEDPGADEDTGSDQTNEEPADDSVHLVDTLVTLASESEGTEDADASGSDGDAAETTAAGEADEERELTQAERAQATLIWSLYVDVRDWASENREQISSRVVGTGFDVVTWAQSSATSLGVLGFQAFLTAFFFFFICTGWGRVVEFWERLIPERKKSRAVHLAKQMDHAIAGFIRGRLTIMLIQCVVFAVGFSLIGVPAGVLVGIGVGVLSVVPYLALVGIPVSLGLMLLAGPETGFRSEWWWQIGAPLAFYFLGQALDDYIWTPMIQGKATDLDTPTVLFASIAGGALAGVYGLLIAIPVAACIKIVLREVVWPRVRDWAEGRSVDPLPISNRDGEGQA